MRNPRILPALFFAVLVPVALGCADRRKELRDRLEEFVPVVEKYQALRDAGELGDDRITEKNGKILVDPGPPLRIAFRDSRWGDNWGGFVYDPSGDVLKVGDLRREAEAAGRKFDNWGAARADPDGIGVVIMLFGGAMCGCEHLEGDWYWCAFN